MKLYAEFENGEKVELKEVSALNSESEMIFVVFGTFLRPSDIELFEKIYSEKTNKRVVAFNSHVEKIMSI